MSVFRPVTQTEAIARRCLVVLAFLVLAVFLGTALGCGGRPNTPGQTDKVVDHIGATPAGQHVYVAQDSTECRSPISHYTETSMGPVVGCAWGTHEGPALTPVVVTGGPK